MEVQFRNMLGEIKWGVPPIMVQPNTYAEVERLEFQWEERA